MSLAKKRPVRIYFTDRSYKTILVTEHTTAHDVVVQVGKKMGLGMRLELIVKMGKESRVLPSLERPFTNLDKGVTKEFFVQLSQETTRRLSVKLRANLANMFDQMPTAQPPQDQSSGFGWNERIQAQSLNEHSQIPQTAEGTKVKAPAHKSVYANVSAEGPPRGKGVSPFQPIPPKDFFLQTKNNSTSSTKSSSSSNLNNKGIQTPQNQRPPMQMPPSPSKPANKLAAPHAIPTEDITPLLSRHHSEGPPAASVRVSDFGIDDVGAFLATNGMGEYTEAFREQEIDGPALLALNGNDYKELGVKIGHRKKIESLLVEAMGPTVVWKSSTYPEPRISPTNSASALTSSGDSQPPLSPQPTRSPPPLSPLPTSPSRAHRNLGLSGSGNHPLPLIHNPNINNTTNTSTSGSKLSNSGHGYAQLPARDQLQDDDQDLNNLVLQLSRISSKSPEFSNKIMNNKIESADLLARLSQLSMEQGSDWDLLEVDSALSELEELL